MYYMLLHNKQLSLLGIDKWQVIEGGAYKNNNRNYEKCISKLSKFGKRVQLIQNDALLRCE